MYWHIKSIHKIPQTKLAPFRIPHNSLNLFSSHLSNRPYFVEYKGCKLSSWLWRATWFELVVSLNDLESSAWFWKLLVSKLLENVYDCTHLQLNINKLSFCSNKYKLLLNIQKWIVMFYHRLRNSTDYTSIINDVDLVRCFKKTAIIASTIFLTFQSKAVNFTAVDSKTSIWRLDEYKKQPRNTEQLLLLNQFNLQTFLPKRLKDNAKLLYNSVYVLTYWVS